MNKLRICFSLMFFLPIPAFADYSCPDDSDTCSYVVNTGETPKVGAGGGGKTADKKEWINAPSGKYLVNGTATIQSQNGKSPVCAISGTSGAQSRRISGVDIKVYAKYQVHARAETGSGLQAVGKTAHMHCAFTAQVVNLPE